ncbi:MAG: hypothetical protein L0387_05175, partial [Acidobacteria bacterium]|nr:hypothetical protein [Acidobacteriota bacterium]
QASVSLAERTDSRRSVRLTQHPGSAGVPPASVRPEAAPMACGPNCGRDARAPSVGFASPKFASPKNV